MAWFWRKTHLGQDNGADWISNSFRSIWETSETRKWTESVKLFIGRRDTRTDWIIFWTCWDNIEGRDPRTEKSARADQAILGSLIEGRKK